MSINKNRIKIEFKSDNISLKPLNSSFDVARLNIAYAGKNRNGSFISKEVFEKCIDSMYNCPIVCHYDRETNSLGGHDIEFVSSENKMKIVNITEPVGVVPAGAKYWWEEIEDENGLHEYLVTEVYLWKRQEAYEVIKEKGITGESMEIGVLEGRIEDGIYIVEDFEFEAFCLLGDNYTPCFEGASLETFSLDSIKEKFALMMEDMKNTMKEGEILEDIKNNEPMEIDEALETPADDEIEITDEPNTEELGDEAGDDDFDEEDIGEDIPEEFTLTERQFIDEAIASLSKVRIETEWGESERYWYEDSDREAGEIYFIDRNDWNLYGAPFTMNGDKVEINYEGCKRKKYVYVDYDEGAPKDFALNIKIGAEKAFNDYTKVLKSTIDELTNKLTLIDKAAKEEEIESVFEKFSVLGTNEDFEALKSNHKGMSAKEIEEKCFALHGRITFNTEKNNKEPQKAPKIMVIHDDGENKNKRYGDLFDRICHN